MQTAKKFYGITLVLACGLTATLKAQDIYVANAGSGTIGEYTLSGATVNASLISGLDAPSGIAIWGNDIFVSSLKSGIVGEYTLSGATVNASLITGLVWNYGVAVSGNDLFICNQDVYGGVVSEYTTSGATVNPSLISGIGLGPYGIAISGNDVFVADGQIDEYTSSGAFINQLYYGLDDATDVAISGNDLFIANDIGYITEYTTSGTLVNFELATPASGCWGIANYGNELFVTSNSEGGVGEGGIAECTTSGAIVNYSLVSGLNNPDAIAISPAPEPSAFALLGLGVVGLWLRRR
jgi:hypothetical protein